MNLPSNAKSSLTWPIEEGGIGVIALTDDAGESYIELYPLNPQGRAAGRHIKYPRSRLMLDAVAGYNRGAAIIVFIDVAVSAKGLDLWVVMPANMIPRYPRHVSAPWGSPLPEFEDCPEDSDWMVITPPRDEKP